MASQLAVHFGAVPEAIQVRRFSVVEYRQLGTSGILTEDDRVELLDGLVSPKMIHSPRHDATLCVVEQLLRDRLAAPWLLRVQCAVTVGNSEPEPDLAVVVGPATRYMNQHPSAEDLRLVVEISDSSVARDLIKAGIYANAEIPEYWLVNLVDQHVQRFQDPHDGNYQTKSILRSVDQLTFNVGTTPAAPIAIDEIFPDPATPPSEKL